MANSKYDLERNYKQDKRTQLAQLLVESGVFGENAVMEVVGDGDLAVYDTIAGVRKVVVLSLSIKRGNTKYHSNRDPEDVMCDLIDGYAAKQEAKRCAAAVR